jgi:hypothetical protein
LSLPASSEATSALGDTVYAVVGANTVHVHHDSAYYNCCPTFDYQITDRQDILEVIEIDFGLEPCR